MSVILRDGNRIETFPVELLQHLVMRFNGVISKKILHVRSSSLEIRFEKFEQSQKQIVVRLFTKLVTSLNSIKRKYLENDEHQVHLSIKMNETEDHYIIKISGSNKIPPGKLFNLFGLILWYYIKYKSGLKASASEFGQNLTEAWKIEEAFTRKQLNTSDKRVVVTRNLRPCQICGEPTRIVSKWKFYYKKERRNLDVETRVCEKHKSTVI